MPFAMLLNMFFGKDKMLYKEFSEYLPDNYDSFVEELRLNVVGTSKNYNGNTLKTIASLNENEKLRLALADAPSADGFTVKILTVRNIQIGWLATVDWLDSELHRQLVAGVDVPIECIKHGLVSGKEVPWCEILIRLGIPYPADETCVYIANNGKLYHAKNDCNKYACRRVPLSYAQRYSLKPCSKCATVS